MWRLADTIPVWLLAVGALLIGMAPWPEPHLVEKLGMLAAGTLTRPLDIFDLFMHAAVPLMLVLRLVRLAMGLPRDGGGEDEPGSPGAAE